jgi:hypothetical protein
LQAIRSFELGVIIRTTGVIGRLQAILGFELVAIKNYNGSGDYKLHGSFELVAIMGTVVKIRRLQAMRLRTERDRETKTVDPATASYTELRTRRDHENDWGC